MTLAATIRARLSPAFTVDVHFAAAPGITMLFGASGSGKTTVLRCLAGFHQPDAGRLLIGDEVWFDADTGRSVPPRRRNVGYVFQHLALFPHMTVEANLHYGLAGEPLAIRRERTGAVAESFRIAHLLQRRPGEISGGERQRAALARSLVTNPRLLLLDEPLSALDHVSQSRIIEDLRAWNAAHRIPILYVTHSHREVFALAEHVLVLEAGRIVATGSPEDVINAPALEPLARLAGFENILSATVMAVQPAAGTLLCELGSGGPLLEVPYAETSVGAPVRVALRAGDILVATREPKGLSARNILPGIVQVARHEGLAVVLRVDVGAVLEVRLTPAASETLGLRPGSRVWLVIKTHACRLVAPYAR